MKMKIPWAKPYIGKAEETAVMRLFKTGWLSMGSKVREFEKFVCGLARSKYAIAVNSGTAALDVALKLVGVKEGDEVIIPALSYIATGNAVLYQNAIPVFADIDPATYTLSPKSVKAMITNKTKAVIAIDYAGQPADYAALKNVLKNRKIFLIEDGAPGLGGKYGDKPLCSMGDISTTSFHMAKVFTSVEGGMVFVKKKKQDAQARIIRSQGEDPFLKYHHPVLGHNYRMTDLQASIGLEQVKRYKKILKKREKLANYYSEGLKAIKGIVSPTVDAKNKHAWFLYPILTLNRNKIAAALKKSGVETNISWPLPIYRQKAYIKFAAKKCPVAEKVADRILCLPMYYEMTKKDQDYVIGKLKNAVKAVD